FFVLAGIWTRWPGGARDEKRRRNARQVLANGGVAGLGAMLALLGFQESGTMVMAGTFAAAAADTWATEWGRAFGGAPLSLRTGKRTEPGVSGAVSLTGTVASLLGAASVATALWSVQLLTIFPVILITAAGFIGAAADSIAGARLQAVWQMPDGGTTEHGSKAGDDAVMVRGVRWIDNDVVNGIATATGAISAVLLINIW
ncbi:DUF92 domain-containing protein, partial [bacterium]|nr:DUF92 domain-containing protein [bacterium]